MLLSAESSAKDGTTENSFAKGIHVRQKVAAHPINYDA
jgi:hypothetical protein